MANHLYYGDNLSVLRESIASESVDLVYLDPPFNSNASYGVLFKAPSGEQSAAQIEAFDDTWHWNERAEIAFDEVVTGPHSDASILIRAMRSALGENDMMAYLAMMSVRLIELHRVLKPTGSLYLHCDPTASHYLKILLDAIIGPAMFRNEIIWRRANAHNDPKRFGRITDTILYYSKGKNPTWNSLHTPYREEYYESHFKKDEAGRYYRTVPLDAPRHGAGSPGLLYDWKGKMPAATRTWAVKRETMEEYDRSGKLRYTKTGTPTLLQFADEMPGVPLQNLWADIPPVNPQAAERLGYPTQKPVALLERILSASSNVGDVVLDPFCGCGTTVHAAQKLERQWIGIDVTHLAIGLIERRLKDAFPDVAFEVHGVPADAAGARDLAERDKHEFQKWVVASIGGQPYKGGRKGMDRGIDGYLHFRDADRQPQFAIISVKGGGIKSGDIRDLKGTMEREKAALGIFLTLNEPTREMEREASAAGLYETGGQKVPRLQILTAEQVVAGHRARVPFGFSEGYRQAEREAPADTQRNLF